MSAIVKLHCEAAIDRDRSAALHFPLSSSYFRQLIHLNLIQVLLSTAAAGRSCYKLLYLVTILSIQIQYRKWRPEVRGKRHLRLPVSSFLTILRDFFFRDFFYFFCDWVGWCGNPVFLDWISRYLHQLPRRDTESEKVSDLLRKWHFQIGRYFLKAMQ